MGLRSLHAHKVWGRGDGDYGLFGHNHGSYEHTALPSPPLPVRSSQGSGAGMRPAGGWWLVARFPVPLRMRRKIV